MKYYKCKQCESEDIESEYYKETTLNEAFLDYECKRCGHQWVTPTTAKEVAE
jgi:ribosomal protein S27E